MLADADRYWLAGLLEGEGSFCQGTPSRPNLPYVSMESTDRDIVERVAALLHVAVGDVTNRNPGRWKDSFRVLLRGSRAEELMRDLRPLMGDRRRSQIDKALASVKQRKLKLTGDQGREIARRRRDGENAKALAAEFGVSWATVYDLASGRNTLWGAMTTG